MRARSGLPTKPLAASMDDRSGSLGSPPWQSAQESPAFAWTSRFMPSTGGPSGSGSSLWQLTQVSSAPPARPPATSRNNATMTATGRIVSTVEVGEQRHRHHEAEQQHAARGHERARLAAGGAPVEERDEDEQREDRPKAQDGHLLALEPEEACRHVLEGLRHEGEVPLRPDPAGRGSEGVRLLAELPREERRQHDQHAEHGEPDERLAQHEVRVE